MKLPKNLIKILLSLTSSVALVGTASAKPDGGGNGGGHGGGKEKGNKGGQHSQKGNGQKGHDKAAKNFSKKLDKGKGENKAFRTDQIARFADNDRSSINDYFTGYQRRGEGLPPGLAKKVARGRELPPGWQKKIEPGYRMEDDMWSSFSPVPDEWFPNVRREPDTRFYYHGDRVVRVYEPRREILDVIVVPSLLR